MTPVLVEEARNWPSGEKAIATMGGPGRDIVRRS
jgi:hypothetical protein